MANSVTFQTLVDGDRNVVIKVDGYLDTSDLAATTFADPATLSSIAGLTNGKATALRIDRILWAVDEGLDVRLQWDATSPVNILDLVKAGHWDAPVKFGGFTNNAGAGKTGKILVSTEGWSVGKIYEFTVTLWMVKQ